MVLNNRGVSGEVNVSQIAAIPSFLGNADPIRFVRLLPSVQLNTEAEGGLYMQGSDPSHTLISQEGVPIYGASHLLGLFSVFNAPHFKGMRYETSAVQRARLAGQIDMLLPDTLARKVGADLSLGLLSAQGTFTAPIGSKSSLTVSARRTFINLVYGNMLKFNDEPIKYGFTDANITWLWKPSAKDRVWVDLFGCLDQGSFSGGLVDVAEGSWYNALGAVHWNHYMTSGTLKQSAHFTTFGLYPHMYAFNIYGRMESYIRDYGYRASYSYKNWNFGLNASYFHVQPQNPYSEGHQNDAANNGSVPTQDAFESQLYAGYRHDFGYWFQLEASLGGGWYLSPEKKSYWSLNPEVKLAANLMDAGKLDFTYGIKHQNLFNVGLTHTGLPCEFWVMAGELQKPQWSQNFSLAYNVNLFDRMISLSAELYYRQLYNQLEYVGSFMDIYNGNYSLESSTRKGKGRAYGANLMIQKQKGRLTGWISYAYSRSLRTFDDDYAPGEHPSGHDRPHELDIVATYDFGPVDVGATFVLASGTPFTKPESIYFLANRMVCDYGPYNAERLPAYSKMDISVNWYIVKTPKRTGGINFSMYNVLGQENVLGYGIARKDFNYTYIPFKFNIRFMPSLALFYKF